MEIKNATTVHRVWKDLSSAELLAVFQYEMSAELYCKAAIDKEPDHCMLIHTCHYDGKMKIYHKQDDVPSRE